MRQDKIFEIFQNILLNEMERLTALATFQATSQYSIEMLIDTGKKNKHNTKQL